MNDSPPVSVTSSTSHTIPQNPSDNLSEGNILAYLQFWPAIVVGILITMCVMGINPTHLTPDSHSFNSNLGIWLPPALFIAFLLFAVITLPKAKAVTETAWGRREREARARALEKQTTEAAHLKGSSTIAIKEEAKPSNPLEKAPEKAAAATTSQSIAPGDVDVLILWGSETGTAQGLAEMSESRLKNAGISSVRAVSMADVTLPALAGFKQVLVITSTWGDGEPPSNGIDLWESLQKEKVDLSKTRFSVLSLGDTSYPLFCKCGKDFDQFLEAQGATRIYPRIDCDLEYEANFEKWLSGVQQALSSAFATA